MPTIEIRFPAGRYHATPWESHVNEGVIEWPPSPWRLLRALLATGYTKLGWPPAGPPQPTRTLFEKLSSTLPHYVLPRAAGAHSRHYMPLATLEKGREKTTLVFDTWAQIEAAPLMIHWKVQLSPDERSLFAELLKNLGYLGRAESWVDARLLDIESSSNGHDAVIPCDESVNPGRGWEQVSLLAPTSPHDYEVWREAAIREALPDSMEGKKKLTKAEQKKIDSIEADYPNNLMACLQVDTAWLRKTGWSQPPGTRRVLYWRRSDALEPTATILTRPQPEHVEAILLSMATETGNDHALPSVTRTLPQAELLHRALISILSRYEAESSVLTGRNENGSPLQSAHRHAHVIPLDLDDDGHVEHVLIWAPMGLDASAQAAIRALRKTFTKGGIAPLRVAVAAEGSISELSVLAGAYGERFRAMLGPGRIWRSRTPFIPPRHMKKRGRNTLEGQLVTECETRGLPAPSGVRVIPPMESTVALRQRHFIRRRHDGPSPPVDVAFSIELEFDQPVWGLLALGYASHFGLGLFETVK